MLVLDASRATADELPASHQLVTTWHRDIVRLFDKAERQHQHSVALQVFGCSVENPCRSCVRMDSTGHTAESTRVLRNVSRRLTDL